MADAAVSAYRGSIVDRVKEPISRRTPLSADDVRALIGVLFLFWSVRRIVRALRAGSRA